MNREPDNLSSYENRLIKLPWRWVVIALLPLCLLSCGRKPPEETETILVPDHIGKARALYHQGDYNGAVEMYHKALILDPDNAEAYLQLGIIYDDNLKDEEEAIYFYRQFLARKPDSDKAELVLDWIAKSEKMIKKGVGDEEAVPGPGVSTPPPAIVGTTPPPARTGDKEELSAVTLYRVQKGDTLARIAEKYYGDRTAWKRIYQANRNQLANPDALRVGQVLKIPSARKKAVIEI